MAFAIQVFFSGGQGEDFYGKVGNLKSIEPIYEPPEGGILVGAVITVARPLIPVFGNPCLPMGRFMVTYPLSAKQDEVTKEWNTFIPAELFKPSLKVVIGSFNNKVSRKVEILGDLFGHESYATENQRLHDELISTQITAQFVYERVKKLNAQLIRVGLDVWEGEVEKPMGRALKLSKELSTIVAGMAPRYSGTRGSRGRYPEAPPEEYPPTGMEGEPAIEGEFFSPQKKESFGSKLKFWGNK